MIYERRQEPRIKTYLVTTPIHKPVCSIIKALTPPDGKKGVFFAYSPIVRKVVVGKDYIDAFLRFNQAPKTI
jgi:hypothetical protein